MSVMVSAQSAPEGAKVDPLSLGDHTYDTDEIKGLWYRVRGVVGGPVVVVTSVGWGLSGGYVWNSLNKLEDTHLCVYSVPRGNGRSGRPTDDTRMSTAIMSSDLDLLRQHLGLEKIPALIGHSNGSCLALGYAEQFPDRLGKVVIIDSQIMGDKEWSQLNGENFRRYLNERKDMPEYADAVAAITKLGAKNGGDTDEEFLELLTTAIPLYFTDTTKAHLLAESMADPDFDGVPLSLWAYQKQGAQDDSPNRPNQVAEATKVKADVLVVHGDDDFICPLVWAQRIADILPSAELAVFETCGHCPWLEQPEKFWSLLRKFLAK